MALCAPPLYPRRLFFVDRCASGESNPRGPGARPSKGTARARGFQPANGATTVDVPHALRRSLVLAELTLSWSLRQDGTPTRVG